jgi:hypothetical protein
MYSASAVKNYDAASSLVRSENNLIFFDFGKKRSGLLVVKSEVVALAPALIRRWTYLQ